MRLWVVLLVLLVGTSLVEGKNDDEEDSYGDEMMDKKEEMMRKKSGSRRVRPSERPPRASAPTRVLKSQEKANCPIGCTCNRTSVSCINVDGDASLFQQIQPIAFPAMDTLVLTGNRFADISGSGLFGNKNVHDMLTLANFSDNRISGISQETFANMPHLEYLYLSNNLIDKTSKNPFGILKKLRKLYLAKALKNPATTLSSMFDTHRNQLVQLESIDLSSNKIEKIEETTFCKVNGVAELLLSKNSLSSFEVGKNCLNGLMRLDLSGNLFNSFSSALFDALPNLFALDISDNPLVCDCDLKPFIEFAQKEDSRFLNQDKTVCASPQALYGKSIFRLKTESVCVPKSSNVFSNLFLLVLFCTVGFFIYRFYRHRIPSPAVFQFGRRSAAPPPTYREIGEGGRIISREGSPDEEDSIFENPLYTFDNPAWAR
ncbi:hypothetical protein PMAYCL1PPCAC_21888 [Pristionchus mayeri]|uniref:LRRCT domain-containing protein n=1 Tax=Pristionchus mayeri TaxID=1317129 RepID=A0AAN5CVK4_9BILA|nr:hypothetical protein PMAYCL1PPCAC_21888 [Pristionchus mayeri]